MWEASLSYISCEDKREAGQCTSKDSPPLLSWSMARSLWIIPRRAGPTADRRDRETTKEDKDRKTDQEGEREGDLATWPENNPINSTYARRTDRRERRLKSWGMCYAQWKSAPQRVLNGRPGRLWQGLEKKLRSTPDVPEWKAREGRWWFKGVKGGERVDSMLTEHPKRS